MAGRVIFINRGRVVFDGTPAEMQAGYASLDDAFRALSEGASAGAPHAGRRRMHTRKRVSKPSCGANWPPTSPRPPDTSSSRCSSS
jgi:ABC-type uncharacterized transport system ATPase subunit